MNKVLHKTEFGNPVLRSVARRLNNDEIVSVDIQQLLQDMYHTLEHKKYGVGIAAPQVGLSVAISVIDTKPTPTRPELARQQLTIINPEIVEAYGRKKQQWEGCISGSNLYAKVPRYTKVRLKWLDEKAEPHEQDFDGFLAHVIQHEVDHLNGVLFVDRVVDAKTYMTFGEYKKMRDKES
jgi:peptide deformylase